MEDKIYVTSKVHPEFITNLDKHGGLWVESIFINDADIPKVVKSELKIFKHLDSLPSLSPTLVESKSL